jgi:FADH2 O2-dependent halogenase
MASGENAYDVVILGTGLTGSLLGATLAANGLRVLLTDTDTHPKCEPGEVLPYDVVTTLRRLADRFRIPAIRTLTRYDNCREIAGPVFGVNRYTVMTAHHRGGTTTTIARAAAKSPPLSHLYRPASDGYLFYQAVLQGCDARQGWRISGIKLDDEEIVVTGADSASVRGRYLVDTTPALRSPLVSELGLQPAPPPGRCRRLSWTHLAGVAARETGEGLTCHVFDDAWLWLAPFNNDHQSRNPLCAVGIVADDPAGEGAEACFAKVIGRLPELAGQLAGAVPLREWQTVSPVSYAVGQLHGSRWCLIGPAAGAVDPLFGGNFRLAARAVEALVPCLLKESPGGGAVGEEVVDARFAATGKLQHDLIELENRSVTAAYGAVHDQARTTSSQRAWS